LIRCGAISYGIDQLVQRYQECQKILDCLPLQNYTGMKHMFDQVIDPVIKMLAAFGLDQAPLPPISTSLSGCESGGNIPN